MIDKNLTQEIEKRVILRSLIEYIVDKRFDFNENKRLMRGKVHDLVAEDLNMVLNNELCSQIIKCIKNKGCKSFVSQGVNYYSNIGFKNNM